MWVCRKARKQFPAALERPRRAAGTKDQLSVTERAALERHLLACKGCALEYRIYALGQATLDCAASVEAVTPDEDFYKALKARIARGPELAPSQQQDESWTVALFQTARHMIPAMAMLLLLILGATFLWNSSSTNLNSSPSSASQAFRSRDVNQEPTPDDFLESFVAVEERWDGK